MNVIKDGIRVLKSLVDKLGVKTTAYRLHLSKTYLYLWFKGEDLECRRSPVEMVDELISMGIAGGHYKEVLDLLNHFNGQFYGGHYTPEESLLGEIIGNLQAIKNEAKGHGK
jgi:hypothetical protein